MTVFFFNWRRGVWAALLFMSLVSLVKALSIADYWHALLFLVGIPILWINIFVILKEEYLKQWLASVSGKSRGYRRVSFADDVEAAWKEHGIGFR